jgi:hypothetical protein
VSWNSWSEDCEYPCSSLTIAWFTAPDVRRKPMRSRWDVASLRSALVYMCGNVVSSLREYSTWTRFYWSGYMGIICFSFEENLPLHKLISVWTLVAVCTIYVNSEQTHTYM